jgi:hypothetical protein
MTVKLLRWDPGPTGQSEGRSQRKGLLRLERGALGRIEAGMASEAKSATNGAGLR